MNDVHIEHQSSYIPNNEVKTSDEFFQKLGNYKIDALRNKQDKGEYWQFDLPVDNMYYVPQRDTFTIKKILFEQITKKQEIDEETGQFTDDVKNNLGRVQEQTKATAETTQQTKALEAEARAEAELDKPLWNTYEGYIKALEALANDFEKIRQISDKAERINKTGKQTLKHVEKTAKQRKKHLAGVIANVKKQQVGMNLKNNEPVGAIHEENFLEIFDVYVALKNDLEHGEHGELSKEARGPNDSKKEIKRNTKEIKKHFKRQKEINQLLAEQELLKIANDNENLLEKLLREMIDGKMDPAHQSYYQLLFHWIGQHASNYPLMWNSLIELTKVHPQFANQVGYTVRYSGDSRYGGGTSIVSSSAYERGGNELDVSKLDIGETFAQGGAKGLIRKVFDAFPNLTEAQKNTWSNVGFAALLGVGIWQAGKWLFKKGNFRHKASTIGGVLLGSQILFGESFPSLLHKIAVGGLSFKELLDRVKNSLSFQSNETQRYTEDTRLMCCFGGFTPGQITTQMGERKKDPQSWAVFIEGLKKSDPDNAQALVTKFGNPVKVKELEKWLTAVGVGFPVAPHLAGETMSDIRKYQNENYQILQDWLIKNGKKAKKGSYENINKILTRKEPLTPAEIEQMDKDGLFEKDKEALTPEELKQLDMIHAQIDELDLTPNENQYLKVNATALYGSPDKDVRPQFGFKKSVDAGKAIMTYKGQEILINVSNFSLPHFNDDKAFNSHLDCLNTAYVAASLVEMKRNTPTQNSTPFSYNPGRKGIVFDDAVTLSWKLDTRMLTTGWFGASKEVSREVGENPQAFADYLNYLWQQQQGTRATEHFETLPDTAQTKDQIKQLGLSPNDAYLVQKACNDIYATYGEGAKTLGIHFRQEGNNLIFTSYGKEMKINLTTKTLEGFTTTKQEEIPFANLAELIKAANLINAIKYHSTSMTALANIENGEQKHEVHPFYIDTYGNVMFRGTGENTTVATGIHSSINRLPRLDNVMQKNSPTLNTHKYDLIRYLNSHNPPFRLRYDEGW